MCGQHVAEPVPILGTPAHRYHQHRDNGGGNPAEAEQANLGSNQLLQHLVSGSRGNGRPAGSGSVMMGVLADQVASANRTGSHVVPI